MARLVRIRDENIALTRGIVPNDIPAARTAMPSGVVPAQESAGARHSARRARTSEVPPARKYWSASTCADARSLMWI